MEGHAFEAYVTNLGKYAEGELKGEWVKFPNTTEEIKKVFERIGMNAEYEEYFITDYNSEKVDGLHKHLGEYEKVEDLNYLAGRILEMDEGELQHFNAIMKNNVDMEQEGVDGCINLTYNLDKYIHYPDVNTEEELGIYHVKELETFNLDSMGDFAMYFDYEAYGRDVSINEGGIFTKEGYICNTGESWKYEYDGNPKNIPDEFKLEKDSEVQTLMANLKTELSKVKTEISGLRKEIGSKERNEKNVSKKDTKKKSGR